MKTNSSTKKLSTELMEENSDINNKKSNIKSNLLLLTTLLICLIVLFILPYFSFVEKEKKLITETSKIFVEKKPKKGNWIDTIFKITETQYTTSLLGLNGNGLEIDDVDVYINGTLVQVNKSSPIDPQLIYKFNKTGIYNIKFNIKKTLTTMTWLFSNNHNIVSVNFLEGFDSSQVTSMEHMFGASNIQSIDMRHLNTEKLQNLRQFITINNYNYNYKTKKIIDHPIIDLTSFDTSKITNCIGMFHEVHEEVLIKISNKFTKCREQIPYFNRVLNIDEEMCHLNFRECKTCIGSHETLKCGECREGFKLMKNGFCKRIENSFVAKYNVTSTSKPVHLVNLDGKNMQISNFELFVDGKKVMPIEHNEMVYGTYHYFISYNFKNLGIHEVKIFFKKTPTTMAKLFYLCFDLVSIKFSDTFDSSKVQSMLYMFGECTSLKSVDVSSFNTSLVGDFMALFDGCSELTSLDLSNFEITNAFCLQNMFDSMKKLKYLDISSFYLANSSGTWFINNSAKDVTIVLGRKNTGLIIPSGWKRIYKD